ncbi:MAG TPA: hypothetical protein VIH18_11660 [Candidatus Binatia bacterium]|jgi:hypothetical protein
MKRWLYIGSGVVLGILILVAIGLYFLLSSLDSIVKAAVEKFGSDMTQATVRLNDVEIELTSGKGALRGLAVGNPPGFKSERALSLGEIGLELDVGTVTKDPVVIKEISITAPEVTYEFGLKGSNLDALKQNVDAYSAQGKAAEKKTDEAGKKLVIEHLYIRNGKVNVSATELQGKTASTSLPDIHLTGIGKKTGGATAAEVAEQVVAAIGQGAARAAATTDIGGLLDKAKGEAAGAIGGAAKEGATGLKGFFGK